MAIKYCTYCGSELYYKGWILCDIYTGKQHNPYHLEIHFEGAEMIAFTEFNTALQLLEQQKRMGLKS